MALPVGPIQRLASADLVALPRLPQPPVIWSRSSSRLPEPKESNTIRYQRVYLSTNCLTLDPNRLGPSDVIELGISGVRIYDRQALVPRVKPSRTGSLLKRSPSISDEYWRAQAYMTLNYRVGSRHLPFPPDSSGWLYFYRGADRPTITGEVRFRLALSGNPKDFASGSDLLHPDGLPWKIPLLHIATVPKFKMLQNILLRDKFVDLGLLARCDAIVKQMGCPHRNHAQLLSSLDDVFVLDFSHAARNLYVWRHDEELFTLWALALPVVDSRTGEKLRPYTGRVLCRFERSSLPIHADNPTLVVRIMKITEPIQCTVPGYDGYVEKPVEGALIRHGGSPAGIVISRVKPESLREGLQLLYDSV